MSFTDKIERKLSGWIDSGVNKIKFEKRGYIGTIVRQNDQFLWEIKHKSHGIYSYGKCQTEELARMRVEGKIQ